jgi:hypothetical protein
LWLGDHFFEICSAEAQDQGTVSDQFPAPLLGRFVLNWSDSIPMIFGGEFGFSNGESTPCETRFGFRRLCPAGWRLTSSARARLSGLLARRQRVDEAAATRGEGHRPATAKSAFRETISRLMTRARDHLSRADTVTIAAIETRVLALVEARAPVERFQAMVHEKLVVDLDT